MDAVCNFALLAAEAVPGADAATWATKSVNLSIALILVAVNGFFVAAEFALVKVRISQIDELARRKRPFAKTAKWLAERLDGSLSACQLGITMASLALGWVGEPAFASLIRPFFALVGISSPALIHTVAFAFAFTIMTALHLVIGEQAPKIFAIRRPEDMVLWCAVPLKFFYIVSYPLLMSLNWSTSVVLRRVGIEGASDHDSPHSEDEIRALLREAHVHGNLSRSEHKLLNAVFEFDDMVCRRVMLPRGEVDFFDINHSLEDSLTMARRTKHTRYPICDGSLDKVLGVIHLKDLVGVTPSEAVDIKALMRPPKYVPENIPISRVLRHFQATHQLLAFVVDEHGTVTGIVTLENVLEEIVGAVEDEFDLETPDIVPDGPDQFVIKGSTPIEDVNLKLGLNLDNTEVDTFTGALTAAIGRVPEAADKVNLDGATAHVLEVKNARAVKVRVVVTGDNEAAPS